MNSQTGEFKTFQGQGGNPGIVVMGIDSHSEGRGFESRHCILDGHFSHIIAVKL